MAKNINVGDLVRYIGDDPRALGATGTVKDVGSFFPGSVVFETAEGRMIGTHEDEVELLDAPGSVLTAAAETLAIEAPKADLKVGDRVKILDASGSFAANGALGTVDEIPVVSISPTRFDLIVTLDGGFPQGFRTSQVEKVDEAVSEPEGEELIGQKVKVIGFDSRLNGLVGVVDDYDEDSDLYEVEVPDGPEPYVGDTWSLERDEFEIVTDEARTSPEVKTALSDDEVNDLGISRFDAAADVVSDPLIRDGLATLALGFALGDKANRIAVLRALLDV